MKVSLIDDFYLEHPCYKAVITRGGRTLREFFKHSLKKPSDAFVTSSFTQSH